MQSMLVCVRAPSHRLCTCRGARQDGGNVSAKDRFTKSAPKHVVCVFVFGALCFECMCVDKQMSEILCVFKPLKPVLRVCPCVCVRGA